MLSAKMIPEFTDQSAIGARAWWDSMLELGLYIHPEDDPASYVDRENGQRALDDSACEKVSEIYGQMFASLGESESYDVGMAAWYNYQGYVWDASKDEWVPKH